jgi:hypothetical protein
MAAVPRRGQMRRRRRKVDVDEVLRLQEGADLGWRSHLAEVAQGRIGGFLVTLEDAEIPGYGILPECEMATRRADRYRRVESEIVGAVNAAAVQGGSPDGARWIASRVDAQGMWIVRTGEPMPEAFAAALAGGMPA